MHHDEIERYLREVGLRLRGKDLFGEILILGGAYMTLVLRSRGATRDVDAYFARHAEAIRQAAAHVAQEHGLPEDWLNDAVKGFLYVQPETRLWADFPGLRIYAPDPAYIFAMKALAGRPTDLDDLATLRIELRLTSAADALAVVKRYVPERLLTARVQYLVEDLFDEDDGSVPAAIGSRNSRAYRQGCQAMAGDRPVRGRLASNPSGHETVAVC